MVLSCKRLNIIKIFSEKTKPLQVRSKVDTGNDDYVKHGGNVQVKTVLEFFFKLVVINNEQALN
jgi:hypothetical protein